MVFLRRQQLQVAEEPPAARLLAVRVHRSPVIPGLPLTMAGQQPRVMTMTGRCAILGKHLPLPVTGK
jgi:hypothetical protein